MNSLGTVSDDALSPWRHNRTTFSGAIRKLGLWALLSLTLAGSAVAATDSVPLRFRWTTLSCNLATNPPIVGFSPSFHQACLDFIASSNVNGGCAETWRYSWDNGGTRCEMRSSPSGYWADVGGSNVEIGLACPYNAYTSTASPDICHCKPGYMLNAATTACVPCQPPKVINPQTGVCELPTYTITLTPERTTTEPSSNLALHVLVEDKDHQPPPDPIAVKISLKVDPKSGGHEHGDNTRPRGSIAGTKCESDDTCRTLTTDDNGKLGFSFTAEEAAGTHTITVACEKCSNSDSKKVDVKVPNLTQIHSAPPLYTLIGGVEGKHTDNHYLTGEALDILFGLAADYHLDQNFWQPSKLNPLMLAPPQPLGFNDASLIWGGKFDLSGKWTGNHYEHHQGTVIDIRANNKIGAVAENHFKIFKELFSDQAALASLECTSNKVDGMGRNPENGCIGKDGSFDDNRHFHVRILGR